MSILGRPTCPQERFRLQPRKTVWPESSFTSGTAKQRSCFLCFISFYIYRFSLVCLRGFCFCLPSPLKGFCDLWLCLCVWFAWSQSKFWFCQKPRATLMFLALFGPKNPRPKRSKKLNLVVCRGRWFGSVLAVCPGEAFESGGKLSDLLGLSAACDFWLENQPTESEMTWKVFFPRPQV